MKRREVSVDGAKGRRFVHSPRSKIAEHLLNEARNFLASPHEPCASWPIRRSLQAGEESTEALGVTERAPQAAGTEGGGRHGHPVDSRDRTLRGFVHVSLD